MIALSFALPEESKGIVQRLAGATRSGPDALPVIAGRLGRHEVVVVHSGMGMASTTGRLATFLETHVPAAWIASGFGGGLAAELRVGEIVIAENFSDSEFLEVLPSLGARTGALITTRDVIETAAQKGDLARHTGAMVVDMETAAIYRLCKARGIPMLAVRAISDSAGQDLPVPAAVWFDTERQRPRPVPLLAHLVSHPGRIAPFIRFVRGVHCARASLTEFLLAALDGLQEK